MVVIGIKKEDIIETKTRVQRDNDMNFDEVLVVRLWDGFVYELYGNWKGCCGWGPTATQLQITDNPESDCLVVRKRPSDKLRKPLFRNFDGSLPHPVETIEMRISGSKRTFFTYAMRAKEDSRIYQMDHESGTQFLRRIEKACASKHLI